MTTANSRTSKKRKQRTSGARAKAKGKTGERMAADFLLRCGWYIADKETQGMAGDDIFARDPQGMWWSIEVKNTNMYSPKYISQAKTQAKKRLEALQSQQGSPHGEYLEFMGAYTFGADHWLLMWHPSNSNAREHQWVAVVANDEGYSCFLAPFKGE